MNTIWSLRMFAMFCIPIQHDGIAHLADPIGPMSGSRRKLAPFDVAIACATAVLDHEPGRRYAPETVTPTLTLRESAHLCP